MRERHLGRLQTRYICFMQLNNEPILRKRELDQQHRWCLRSLCPVPKAPAVTLTGSAPKARANPQLRGTNTVTAAKHRGFK